MSTMTRHAPRRSRSGRPGGPRSSRRPPARRQRREWRRWLDRRSWRLYALLGGLLAALLVASGYVAAFTSALGVRHVQVSGERLLTAARVTAAAGIGADTPLARLDPSAVERRVRALAPVAAVEVGRHWPHTVTIRVTERSAVVYTLRGGAPWLIDRSGRAFWRAASAPAGLVRIDSTPTRAVPGTSTPGTTPPGIPADAAGPPATVRASDAVRAAVAVATEIPAALRRSVRSVSAATPDSVIVHLSDNRTVLWGTPDDGAAKARVLPGLLHRDATTYDLSGMPDVVVH